MKKFNTTGLCISEKHYLVDTTNKLKKIFRLIDAEEYFTINRSRQFGKTTTLSLLKEFLESKKEGYLVIETSFEGLGEHAFSSEQNFCNTFITLINRRLEHEGVDKKIIRQWNEHVEDIDSLDKLSTKITKLVENVDKDVVLMIDEVDKASDNKLFLHFLGMLRNKYLDRGKGYDKTFKSVILAGVYDVKNLKLKLRPDEEKKYNSPWNIAVDFKVDLSFLPEEISTMLEDYEKDFNTGMDIKGISNEIYKYTSGYPFLVSKLCKLIDEELDSRWNVQGVQDAIKILLDEQNTLFDDLIKNIENYKDVYNVLYRILIDNETISYNPHAYSLGIMFGIFKNVNRKLAVHNKIFEVLLYNYLIAKKNIEDVGRKMTDYTAMGLYENEDGSLDIYSALLKYQEYMKSVYGKFDKDFIERQGRLLLLAFFKPVINGRGFYFVESHTGFDQRQDVVITYGDKKYIIELKIWRGEEYHKKGLGQLKNYLDLENADEGYLVVYDKREEKEYKSEWIDLENRKVFGVWV